MPHVISIHRPVDPRLTAVSDLAKVRTQDFDSTCQTTELLSHSGSSYIAIQLA
jgi:hypothetical protein